MEDEQLARVCNRVFGPTAVTILGPTPAKVRRAGELGVALPFPSSRLLWIDPQVEPNLAAAVGPKQTAEDRRGTARNDAHHDGASDSLSDSSAISRRSDSLTSVIILVIFFSRSPGAPSGISHPFSSPSVLMVSLLLSSSSLCLPMHVPLPFPHTVNAW